MFEKEMRLEKSFNNFAGSAMQVIDDIQDLLDNKKITKARIAGDISYMKSKLQRLEINLKIY